MKITAIKTFMGVFGSRPRGLLKVETDEGIYGWGETYSIGPDLSIEPIADYIAKMIVGEDPRRIEYIMMKINQQYRFPPGGVGLAVSSAVDHALWDISGKAAGLPVYQLLGGTVRDRIRVYQGIGGKDGKQVAETGQALNEQFGFTAFKTSPFQLDMNTNRWGRVCSAAADYFEDIRKHCPDNWEFAFDPHAKIFEPVRALQLANALAPFDPYFYEEPLRPEHTPAWAKLRAQMQIPLATGECLYTRFEFLDLMAAQAADIIQPDVCVCGGLLEMRKIAAIAEAHYVSVMPHNPMGPIATAVNVHFAAATPNFEILEYIVPGAEWRSWVDDPYMPKDGYLELRDRPGLGIDVNEEALVPGPLSAEDKAKLPHWQRTSPVLPDGSTGYI
jgi:galactonate dehydratase